MTFPNDIHVPLTPMQRHILQELRRDVRQELGAFTDEELQKHIVGVGILTLDKRYGEPETSESPQATGAGASTDEQRSDFPRRHLGDVITISLPEELRLRLEQMLTACPTLREEECFTTLLDLALESLIELRVMREKDLVLPAAAGVQ